MGGVRPIFLSLLWPTRCQAVVNGFSAAPELYLSCEIGRDSMNLRFFP